MAAKVKMSDSPPLHIVQNLCYARNHWCSNILTRTCRTGTAIICHIFRNQRLLRRRHIDCRIGYWLKMRRTNAAYPEEINLPLALSGRILFSHHNITGGHFFTLA